MGYAELKYEVHYLDVKDADAIIIKYKAFDYCPWKIVLIDAGNVGDGEKIRKCIGKSDDNYYHIDYAFCTHPDKDHKGGFFELLEDNRVVINKLCLIDPSLYLNKEDFYFVNKDCDAKQKSRKPFSHPDDTSKNLIELADSKGILCPVKDGFLCKDVPVKVLGPSDGYYREKVLDMVSRYAELTDDSDTTKYDEKASVDEKDAKSVIDEDDDDSATNSTSLILLFFPENSKFLFTGDANCASLQSVINKYKQEIKGCKLKVPHHGSKHNLNTKIIDELKPSGAIISASGSRKHPSSGIVYWLSKYCNVYSTHKTGSLFYSSEPVNNPAEPLKARML